MVILEYILSIYRTAYYKALRSPGMMVHGCNSIAWVAKVGGL